jgi:hypothetical protein
MTNNNHTITPPPELVEQWREEAAHRQYGSTETDEHIAEQAARWSADMELDACCEWLDDFLWVVQPNHQVHPMVPKGAQLRKHRRPKPPSLKEQALQELDLLTADATTHGLGFDAPAIRRALESLPS